MKEPTEKSYAIEFFMTYGLAILIVLFAVGILAYFGVLSPESFLPSSYHENITNEGTTFQVKKPENSLPLISVFSYDYSNETPVWEIKSNGSFYWHGELVEGGENVSKKMVEFFTNREEFCGCEQR